MRKKDIFIILNWQRSNLIYGNYFNGIYKAKEKQMLSLAMITV